jgi:transposase
VKVWRYGYLTRLRSRRELERAWREPWSLGWLRGRHAPDHNTLGRCWKENGGARRQVFRQGVKVAAEHGLSGLLGHAGAGTKIRAASARRGVEHRPALEPAWGQVAASIREMERAVEAGEAEEEGE